MKRKPRILMVAPTRGPYGGIEAFTCQIAREVIDSGDFEVRVVFRLRPGCKIQPTFTEGLKSSGVPWRVMRRPDRKYLADLLWADAIHCHFPLLYATLPARVLRKPLVITVENRFIPAEHKAAHRSGLMTARARWYISSFVAETWEGTRLQPGSRIVPAVSELPWRWKEPSERKGFFFIARWVPLKGIEELVEAYATAEIDHASHRLALFGDGPLREEIETRIQQLGIGGFIDRAGFVDHETKAERMASSLWNVAPAAFEEDLGLSPIEARSCGVPSIVTRIGGLPEAAGNHSLLCEPGDVTSLRQALENAVGISPPDYAELANASKESLKGYLPHPGFYAEEFGKILRA
ncbi:MAG: glycosyltransferase family 4 protein [Luteolibacter sp.]